MYPEGKKSLADLGRSSCDPCDPCAPKADYHHEKSGSCNWLMYGILFFIVLTIIIWLIIVAVKPKWVLRGYGKKAGHDHDKKDKCEVDWGRAFVCALVIAFIITIILWVICAIAWGGRGQGW